MTQPVCHRHPDRVAGVACQRCGRPICPSCMVQASVGFHCPECAGARSTTVRSGRAAFSSGSDDRLVAKVLIGINVVVFAAMVATAGDVTGAGGPVLDGASGPVFEQGAMWGPAVAAGEWYRLVSGAFLHAGLLHLGFNMFLLWLLAAVLEPALGRAQFALLYVVSLLGGSLGVMLLSPDAITVGASGAVFGLMGATVVLQMRAGQNPWQSGIGGLVLLNLLITFVLPGISIGGHLGGLLVGALASLVLVAGPRRSEGLVPRLAGLGALAALLAYAAVTVADNQFPFLTA